VYVLQGASRDALVDKVCAAYDAGYADPQVAARYREEYDYYPSQWIEPYLGRRRQNGWSLYGLLGIAKGDKDRMHAQHRRNFRFFDAPVGLIFTIHRAMGVGSLLDYGMFMQNIMVAARAAACTPARRRRGTTTAPSSCRTWARGPTRSWCAAWRWAGPTPRRRSTASRRRARASKASRAGSIEPAAGRYTGPRHPDR
jgi:hypothetical protein